MLLLRRVVADQLMPREWLSCMCHLDCMAGLEYQIGKLPSFSRVVQKQSYCLERREACLHVSPRFLFQQGGSRTTETAVGWNGSATVYDRHMNSSYPPYVCA